MLSNVINGNDSVRAALHAAMGDNVTAIPAHCPTRMAIMHFISKALVTAKTSITNICVAEDWETVFRGCEKKDEFRTTVLGAY
jgi:hypothetical protein